MALKRCTLLLVVFLLPTSLLANKLYFPQIPYGGGYTTTIVLMNRGTTDVSGSFQLFGQNSSPLMSVPINVAAGGSARLTVPDAGDSINSSWGVVDAGEGTVQGMAIFDSRANGALLTTAGVLGIEAGNSFTVPVDVAGNGIASNTAIAVANVNLNSSVTLVLQLIAESGSGSPSVTGNEARFIALAPGEQRAEFVTALWPNLASGFKGTLSVAVMDSVQQPNSLALTALSSKDGLFSALPLVSGTSACNGCWDY